MLLPEVFLEILHCLERDDLDVMQLCSAALRDIINDDAGGPLRSCDGRLVVYSAGRDQEYYLEHDSYYYTEQPMRTPQELAGRLRNGRVQAMFFEAGTTMSSELVDALVPVKDAFRYASVGFPFYYDDGMIDRCLTEVFFCKEIDILGNDHSPSLYGGIDNMAVFFRLPCVLACQKLTLLKYVETYDMKLQDVVFWLNTAVEYGPKELHCYNEFFFSIGKNFAALLIENFESATTSCQYKIVVYEDHSFQGRAAQQEHLNVGTGENLRIYHVNADLRWEDNDNKPSFVVERSVLP